MKQVTRLRGETYYWAAAVLIPAVTFHKVVAAGYAETEKNDECHGRHPIVRFMPVHLAPANLQSP
jgi:hypothetical protein